MLQASAVAARVGPVDELIVQPAACGRRRPPRRSACRSPIDERWIELSYGVYEGVPHADVPSEVWRRWREDPAFVPEGGESLAALDARVRAACDDLAERARDRTVVVVSHVSPIKSAVGVGARRRHRDRRGARTSRTPRSAASTSAAPDRSCSRSTRPPTESSPDAAANSSLIERWRACR